MAGSSKRSSQKLQPQQPYNANFAEFDRQRSVWSTPPIPKERLKAEPDLIMPLIKEGLVNPFKMRERLNEVIIALVLIACTIAVMVS